MPSPPLPSPKSHRYPASRSPVQLASKRTASPTFAGLGPISKQADGRAGCDLPSGESTLPLAARPVAKISAAASSLRPLRGRGRVRSRTRVIWALLESSVSRLEHRARERDDQRGKTPHFGPRPHAERECASAGEPEHGASVAGGRPGRERPGRQLDDERL